MFSLDWNSWCDVIFTLRSLCWHDLLHCPALSGRDGSLSCKIAPRWMLNLQAMMAACRSVSMPRNRTMLGTLLWLLTLLPRLLSDEGCLFGWDREHGSTPMCSWRCLRGQTHYFVKLNQLSSCTKQRSPLYCRNVSPASFRIVLSVELIVPIVDQESVTWISMWADWANWANSRKHSKEVKHKRREELILCAEQKYGKHINTHQNPPLQTIAHLWYYCRWLWGTIVKLQEASPRCHRKHSVIVYGDRKRCNLSLGSHWQPVWPRLLNVLKFAD